MSENKESTTEKVESETESMEDDKTEIKSFFKIPQFTFEMIMTIAALIVSIVALGISTRTAIVSNQLASESNQIAIDSVAKSKKIATEVAEYQVAFALNREAEEKLNKSANQLRATLNEFGAIYVAAINKVTGLEPYQIVQQLEKVNKNMNKIDLVITKTGVYDRIYLQIEDFLNRVQLVDIDKPFVQSLRNIRVNLQSIRNGGDGYLGPTIFTLITQANIIAELEVNYPIRKM